MRKQIGIVGAGTAGLHLGLYLRQHDVDVTVFTDREPKEYRGMRLLNTVAHHAVTVQRERDLQVDHWPTEEHGYFGHHYFINTPPQPLRLPRPGGRRPGPYHPDSRRCVGRAAPQWPRSLRVHAAI